MKNSFKNLEYIWMNGEIKKIEDSKISILNHSLHYGGAAFEGIRAYNGKAFKLKEHFLRLFHSSNSLNIKVNYSLEELCAATYDILEKNQLKNAYIRPLVFKTSDSLKINCPNFQSNVMIAAWELERYFHENNCNEKNQNEGINVGFAKFQKPSSNFLPFSVKLSGLYALNQMMKNSCESCFDDVIIFDDRGYVTECTTSNIFIVKNNELLTPVADCFLNGITRQTIIQIAHENQIKCKETRITKEDLMSADEAFVCGTAVEILKIASINNEKFFDKKEVGLTDLIKTLYKDLHGCEK